MIRWNFEAISQKICIKTDFFIIFNTILESFEITEVKILRSFNNQNSSSSVQQDFVSKYNQIQFKISKLQSPYAGRRKCCYIRKSVLQNFHDLQLHHTTKKIRTCSKIYHLL